MHTKRSGRQARSDGRHWRYAARLAPLPPLLFAVATWQHQRWSTCTAHRTPETPIAACAGPSCWALLASLAFWTLVAASALAGLTAGIVTGRARRRFAQHRWTSAAVVGLCTPWALLTYTIGYGTGRALPARAPAPTAVAHHGGWQQALRLYATLAGGHRPPVVYAPDLPTAGTIHMDAPFTYSRYHGTDATYQPSGILAVGPPSVVAGAALGHLIGTSIGHLRAAALTRRRWRGHRPARIVVTATTTWCQVGERWLCFDHTSVLEYRLDTDRSCVLTFADAVPLRLSGPAAWCHAVLYAYLRYGPAAWRTAPFLTPLHLATSQLTGVRHATGTQSVRSSTMR